MRPNHRLHSERSGQAVIEMTLMLPWILLLFIAVFDFGFFMYAGIATSNAARAGALATSSDQAYTGLSALACDAARREMEWMPNAASFTTNCASGPLQVTAATVAAIDDATRPATRVRVTYETVQLFPLPFLMGRMTLTRQAEMRAWGI
jgi:Flp pilus assembly protein TadG